MQFVDGSLRLTQAGTVDGKSIILFTPEQVDQLIERLSIEKQNWESEKGK